ncbi:hypothetical protein AGRA3207_007239 [Actinomadura graeca]|uniref:Lipoprotein n=1 Tax=Actinomadura graeca TaxID=2750812 RepID=A0ABX8R3U0_9ACTN|nr:hypothetical protein [Actinomadura graeca]QXJ25710.1 hypothetical protein AGRA3207_007239 [Actinomadura graeca]
MIVNAQVWRGLIVAAIVLGVSAGCDRAGDDDDVRTAVQNFESSVREHDGAAACRALSPKAAESLESGGKDCAAQITDLGLRPGGIAAVQVWGERAQARLSDQTVFLVRFPDGWKIAAAGCQREPEGPYDCEVQA